MDSSQKLTTINHFYEKLLKLQVPCSGSLAKICQASIFQQDVREFVCRILLYNTHGIPALAELVQP
jgi:hypothetical protein